MGNSESATAMRTAAGRSLDGLGGDAGPAARVGFGDDLLRAHRHDRR